MTQTKVKGWCAWHNDTGFDYQFFTRSQEPDKLRLAFRLGQTAKRWARWEERDAEAYTKSLGWDWRECYLTIEDV